MSKHISHLAIALLIGVLVGILIARWLDAQTEPEPPRDKPPKAKFRDNVIDIYEDVAS